jgi:hypothetical protein
MKTTAFTVREDMPVKCCRCHAKLRRDEHAIVAVDGTGFVQYAHDGSCPPPVVHSYDPSRRVVQGSK